MTSICPICASSETKVIKSGVSGGKVKEFADIFVLRCDDCDLDFLETWEDVERARRFYEGGNYKYKPDQFAGPPPKFNSYEHYVKQVEPYLAAGDSVLDIGCGSGDFLNTIRREVSGEIQGVEIDPDMIQHLQKRNIPVWDKPLSECESKPFDIVVMHAFLEHVPRIGEFLEDLKRFLHKDSMVFFSVPHGLDPLVSYYDVPEYREHYYREYHLYYFKEYALGLLLYEAGYDYELKPIQVASITNHFQWIHTGKGQTGTAEYTGVWLPKPLLKKASPWQDAFLGPRDDFDAILEGVDDYYRDALTDSGIGDELHGRMWL